MKKILLILLSLIMIQSVLGVATITSVSSPLENGVYSEGSIIPIEIRFTEPVVIIPARPESLFNKYMSAIFLDTKEVVGYAKYGSGSGTDTLTFNWKIGIAQNTCHLDYSSGPFDQGLPNIHLGSDQIIDTNGNNVDTTMPEPGQKGSLSFNSYIRSETSWPAAPCTEPIPVITEPVVNDPIVDEPVVDEPVVNDPIVDEPVVNDPIVDEPVVNDPIVDEPVVNDPIVDEPVVDEPVVDEPVVNDPIVDEPVENKSEEEEAEEEETEEEEAEEEETEEEEAEEEETEEEEAEEEEAEEEKE